MNLTILIFYSMKDRIFRFSRNQSSIINKKKPYDHNHTVFFAPQVGLEPTTLRLTAECSAIELLRNNGIRRRPTLPGRFQPSTIGAERLNFCVRYGNRWFPLAIVTGKFTLARLQNCTVLTQLTFFRSSYRPISIGKLPHCCAFTADLSPHRLWGVSRIATWNLLLEVGFTLRCLQRLSTPHFASQLCRWHDNCCTRDVSTPVLSY